MYAGVIYVTILRCSLHSGRVRVEAVPVLRLLHLFEDVQNFIWGRHFGSSRNESVPRLPLGNQAFFLER